MHPMDEQRLRSEALPISVLQDARARDELQRADVIVMYDLQYDQLNLVYGANVQVTDDTKVLSYQILTDDNLAYLCARSRLSKGSHCYEPRGGNLEN